MTDKTIYNHLKSWGVEIDHNALQKNEKKRDKKRKHFKRRFSPELKAMMKENSRINNEHIKRVEFVRSTEDQRLVDNIISRRII